MQIILLDRVANLGKLGELVNVSAGYARNYLVPKGIAKQATKLNLEVFEKMRAELEKAAADKLAAAIARRDALADIVVTISGQAGTEGKLFGSVGTSDISDALTVSGFDVAKSEVRLPDGPLRNLGEFEISLHLHSDVDASVTVVVEADE